MDAFSRTIDSISGTFQALHEKRKAAEDDAFLGDAKLEMNKRFAQIETEALNSADASDPNFINILDGKLDSAARDIFGEISQAGGYTPSEEAAASFDRLSENFRISATRNAVGTVHNERVSFLVDGADEAYPECY